MKKGSKTRKGPQVPKRNKKLPGIKHFLQVIEQNLILLYFKDPPSFSDDNFSDDSDLELPLAKPNKIFEASPVDVSPVEIPNLTPNTQSNNEPILELLAYVKTLGTK